MTIAVLDGTGKPFEKPLKVEIGLPRVSEDTQFQPILSARTVQGAANFPYIGCGAPLLARLSGIAELQDQIFEIRGPDQNGVAVTRTLEWYLQRTILVGTARYGGQILAGRSMRATWSDGRDSRSLPVTTGPNGEFRIVTTGPECRSLALEILAGKEGTPFMANPPLPSRLPGGEYSLDPIQWETLPLFLEGRVVDLVGVGVPGALVRLETEKSGPASESGGKGSDPSEAKSGGGGLTNSNGRAGDSREGKDRDREGKGGDRRNGQGSHWAPVPKMTALTDEAGNFRIYGKAYGTRYRLQATRRGFPASILDEVTSGGNLYILTFDGNLGEIDAREQEQEEGREDRADHGPIR